MSQITYFQNQRLCVQIGSDNPAAQSLASLGDLSLPELESAPEPNAVIEAIEAAYAGGYEKSASTEFELAGIVFAGNGDPLCHLDKLESVLEAVKRRRHGVPVTLVTYGLVPAAESAALCERLSGMGVEILEIYLPAANPPAYQKAVQPKSAGFPDVCNLITVASESGLIVKTFSYSGAGAGELRGLSSALGAREFVAKYEG